MVGRIFALVVGLLAAASLVTSLVWDEETTANMVDGAPFVQARMGPRMGSSDEEWTDDLLESMLPSKECGQRWAMVDRPDRGRQVERANEFPSQVRLSVEGAEVDNCCCGGTIIGPRHVLTAAHCFGTQSRPNVTVAAPLAEHSEPHPHHKQYRVARVCTPPEFSCFEEPFHHDLALLVLAEPIEFNCFLQPACLPRRPAELKTELLAVGHGMSLKGAPSNTTWLQVFPVRPAVCKLAPERHWTRMCLENQDPLFEAHTCAERSCGPVYSVEDGRQVVVGATSYGRSSDLLGGGQFLTMDVYAMRKTLAKLMMKCHDWSGLK